MNETQSSAKSKSTKEHKSASGSMDKVIKEKLEEAARHRKNGHLKKAKNCYVVVLGLDKNNMPALTGMVSIYEFQCEPEKAKKYNDKIKKLQGSQSCSTSTLTVLNEDTITAPSTNVPLSSSYQSYTASSPAQNSITLPITNQPLMTNPLQSDSQNRVQRTIFKPMNKYITHPKRINNLTKTHCNNSIKLFKAIEKADIKKVKKLLENGCDIDYRKVFTKCLYAEYVPLTYAIYCATYRRHIRSFSDIKPVHIEIMKLLIEYGASLWISTPEVIFNGFLDLFKIIDIDTLVDALNAGNPFDLKLFMSFLITDLKCSEDDMSRVVKALLERGVDPQNLIYLFVHDEKKIAQLGLILSYMENIDVKNEDGWSYLTIALFRGYKHFAKVLIANGADIKNIGDELSEVLKHITSIVMREINIDLKKEIYDYIRGLILEQLAFSGKFKDCGDYDEQKVEDFHEQLKKDLASWIQPLAKAIKKELKKCLEDKNTFNLEKNIFEIETIRTAISYAINKADRKSSKSSSRASGSALYSASMAANPHTFFAPVPQPQSSAPTVIHHYHQAPPPAKDFADEVRQNINTVANFQDATANLVSAFSNVFNF